MRLIKCENGHVYDADKLKNCPHCQGIVKNIEEDVDTYGKGQADVPTEVSAKRGDVSDTDIDMRKNVGLMVETSGKNVGKAFTIYEGMNRIGRAGNMEVSLSSEDTVSRNGHAEIVYESGCFEIYAVKEDRKVYVNGAPICGPVELKDRDVIGIGECEFSFIIYDDVY